MHYKKGQHIGINRVLVKYLVKPLFENGLAYALVQVSLFNAE